MRSIPISSTTHPVAHMVTTDRGQTFELHYDPRRFAEALVEAHRNSLSHAHLLKATGKTRRARQKALQSTNTD